MNTPNPFIEEAVKEFEEKFSNYCGQGGFMWDNGNLNVDAVKAFFGSKLTLAMDEAVKVAYAVSAYQLSTGTVLQNPKEKAFEAGKKSAVEYIKKWKGRAGINEIVEALQAVNE